MTPAGPSRILDILCAYWQSETLKAALDLDLFTILGEGGLAPAELARRCGGDPGRVRRLCDALRALGLVRRHGSRYRPSADAARFLDTRSPDSIAAARHFFNAAPVASAFAALASRIRANHRATGPTEEDWRVFARATASLRRRLGTEIARELEGRRIPCRRILDIGAGASPAGIELLRRRRAATLVVQDTPAVAKRALREAAAAGLAPRVTALAGRAERVAWGGPYDLVLMINVLEYFEPRSRAVVLRKARRALSPGGVLAVHAPLLDARRSGPPEAVAYDLLLLALDAPGGASTYGDLRRELRAAGLASITRSRTLPLVLARRPARKR